MEGVVATIVVVIASALLLFALRANDADMEICMKKHSHDVCFQELNR